MIIIITSFFASRLKVQIHGIRQRQVFAKAFFGKSYHAVRCLFAVNLASDSFRFVLNQSN